MQRWIVPLSAALLAVGMSHVASAQGKGQGNGQGQGQGQAQAQEHDHEKDAYKDKDADKVKSNHGQVVSECNHRANFLNKCLAETDSRYYGGKVPVQKKD